MCLAVSVITHPFVLQRMSLFRAKYRPFASGGLGSSVLESTGIDLLGVEMVHTRPDSFLQHDECLYRAVHSMHDGMMEGHT